jgi:divalent metal cation (Fe/Co/Zn/Cd) transporter
VSIATAQRAAALTWGVRLETLTVAWMAAEALIAIGAGIGARSVLLTAFGFDSVIELLSGIVLLRRLSVERNAGQSTIAQLETATARTSAVLLILLCIYIVATSGGGLAIGLKPAGSLLGIGVAAIAVIAMPLLALAKARANRIIGSVSLQADIAETITCAFMAAVTLLGVGLSTMLGLWWVQYVAALALLFWLLPETREVLAAVRGGHHERG